MVQLPVADAEWQQRNIDRRANLRRMRVVATSLLVLMLAIFVVCWKFESQIPWLGYPQAFAEAGMVGACADWFAVAALFRHPFGLPIPHTAILPQNKQRIADTLGGFFVRHFFNSAEISARLEQVDVARWLSHWLRDSEITRVLAAWSRDLLPPAMELIGASQLRGASRDIIRTGIDSIAAAPLAGRLLAVLISQGQHIAAFDYGLDAAIKFISDNRPTLRQKVADRGASWLPGWADAKLADMLLDGVLDTLAATRSPDHPWRQDYAEFLKSWVARLADDEAIYEQGERIKTEVLDTKLVDDYIAWLATETKAKLKLDWGTENPATAKAFEHLLSAVGERIDDSANIRDAINRSARQLVMNTVVPHREKIGGFVSDVVARWDNKTLVERLELTVGKDLQYIRINGTVVGGAVGLVLYTITRLLG